MSIASPAVYGLPPAAPAERRFYRRVAPSSLLYVAFGADNLGMLVNVSESGLMVSTPQRLALNSVFRVELHLNGLPTTIKIHVRTVWTVESEKRSGIQLLDLSEPDREQIRRWGVLQQLTRHENLEVGASSGEMESSLGTREAHSVSVDSPEELGQLVPAIVPSLTFQGADAGHPENDPIDMSHSVEHIGLRPRMKAKSSKLLLIVWSASMAAICLGTGWSYRHELAEKLLRNWAHGGAAASSDSAKQNGPVATDNPTLVTPDADVRPVPSATPIGNDRTETIGVEAAKLPQPDASESKILQVTPPTKFSARSAKPNVRADAKPFSEIEGRPELSGSEVADSDFEHSPMKDAAPATPGPRLGEARPSRNSSVSPLVTRSSVTASAPLSEEIRPSANLSAPAPVEVRPAADAAPSVTVAPRPSANIPSQASGEIRPSASSSVPVISTPKVLSVDTVPIKSAITGSISPTRSDRLRNMTPSGSSSFAASASANSLANASFSVSGAVATTNAVDRSSSPAVIQMDVPAARVVELTSTSHTASFVPLPGEQVLKSSAITLHIRRSVRVSGDHWLLWRSHKKVVVGGLTSRVDPQIPHSPAGSGTITVQATIAEDGQVIDLKPVNGNSAFLSDVAVAVNEWRYEPTYVDNKPAETQAQIEIDFHPPTTLRASKR